MNYQDLPRLLVISEATLCQTAGGAKQTLYNLLTDYPPEKILHLAPAKEVKAYPPSFPFHDRIVACPTEVVPAMKNRIGAWTNYLRYKLNLSLLQQSGLSCLHEVKAFKPDVLLICPIGAEGLILGKKLQQYFKLPYLIYFMDNWMEEKKSRWFGGSVIGFTHELLKGADGWLMISEPLESILAETYNVKGKRSLIVHNPVDIKQIEKPGSKTLSGQEEITIAYAGSIWPMHYDALAAMAEAVYHLRKEGRKICLKLYTPEAFWRQYEKQWKQWEVKHGGYIHYHDLQKFLRQAHFLLLTASFAPEYRPYSESSVQTKVTDYLSASRPVISIGPTYAAGHYFLNKYQCGFMIDTVEAQEIKSKLVEIISQHEMQRDFTRKGFEILEKKFNAEHVRKDMYNYIHNIYISSNA